MSVPIRLGSICQRVSRFGLYHDRKATRTCGPIRPCAACQSALNAATIVPKYQRAVPPVLELRPSAITWTFNFDAGWGTFGFANSLFDNPREPGVDEQLSDQWFEGYMKPSLSAVYALKSTSEIYGRVSAVGERTYGSVPAAFGEDVSSFGPEDLSIGWRSGSSIETIGENGLDVVVGRTGYQLGRGMLLFDGAAEGGSRGGYWTNARRSFAFAAIGRVRPGPHAVDVPRLGVELPNGTRALGLKLGHRM